MFSFQVHEKSILLPLLPVTMLALRLGDAPSQRPCPLALGPRFKSVLNWLGTSLELFHRSDATHRVAL